MSWYKVIHSIIDGLHIRKTDFLRRTGVSHQNLTYYRGRPEYSPRAEQVKEVEQAFDIEILFTSGVPTGWRKRKIDMKEIPKSLTDVIFNSLEAKLEEIETHWESLKSSEEWEHMTEAERRRLRIEYDALLDDAEHKKKMLQAEVEARFAAFRRKIKLMEVESDEETISSRIDSDD